MKYISVFVLALMLSACVESQSLEQRNIMIQFEQIEQMTKDSLPLSVGEYMALTKVEQVEDGLSLQFVYEVAEYSNDTTTIDIDALRDRLTQENCNNDTFAPLYKDGANVIISYETIEKEPILELRFNYQTCSTPL